METLAQPQTQSESRSCETESLAIAEIAGRDSVAATVSAARSHGYATILPTIALTGTETGDFEAPLRAVERLEHLLGPEYDILDPVYLQEPALWSALNARYSSVIAREYGLCSPCLACHLYMHLLRVPLSWELGGAPLIAGERDSHDGRVKLSQTPAGIDASIRLLAYAGVELLEPVRYASGDEIAALVGADWVPEGGQLDCVLSRNYEALDGSVSHDQAAYERYLSGYLEPAGTLVVDAWRAQGQGGDPPDWSALVRSLLES